LLQAKELRVNYGKAEALKGVSIQVSRGSIVTLIGANGSGKTSMMRAISGLKRLFSGEVWFQGGRIDGLGPAQDRKVGNRSHPRGAAGYSAPDGVGEHGDRCLSEKKTRGKLQIAWKRSMGTFPC